MEKKSKHEDMVEIDLHGKAKAARTKISDVDQRRAYIDVQDRSPDNYRFIVVVVLAVSLITITIVMLCMGFAYPRIKYGEGQDFKEGVTKLNLYNIYKYYYAKEGVVTDADREELDFFLVGKDFVNKNGASDFNTTLKGKFQVGAQALISATIKPGAVGFYILLQADAKGTGDKVFRLRGLVQQSSLIVDYYSDFWNYEQEQYSPTVIRPNMTIELKLRREPTHIEILLNGAFISPFFYPEGYFFIDAIRMGGDILVHDVTISKQRQSIVTEDIPKHFYLYMKNPPLPFMYNLNGTGLNYGEMHIYGYFTTHTERFSVELANRRADDDKVSTGDSNGIGAISVTINDKLWAQFGINIVPFEANGTMPFVLGVRGSYNIDLNYYFFQFSLSLGTILATTYHHMLENDFFYADFCGINGVGVNLTNILAV